MYLCYSCLNPLYMFLFYIFFSLLYRSIVSCSKWIFSILFFACIYRQQTVSAATTATTTINPIVQELSLHIWTYLQTNILCVQLNALAYSDSFLFFLRNTFSFGHHCKIAFYWLVLRELEVNFFVAVYFIVDAMK